MAKKVIKNHKESQEKLSSSKAKTIEKSPSLSKKIQVYFWNIIYWETQKDFTELVNKQNKIQFKPKKYG